MTYQMFDSIDVANLPAGADAYLGYVDGAWPTIVDLRAKFPQARTVSMAVFPADDADGLDIENGDATVPEVYGWFTRQQARKVWRPVLYISAGRSQGLLDTMAANGFTRSSWRLLSAHYDAGEHICGPSTCGYPAADGTQFTDVALGAGDSLIDESLLAGDFFDGPPKPKPKPKPVPHPHAKTGDTMFVLPNGAGAVIAPVVPTAVLGAGGQIAPPTVIRFASNAPAQVAIMLGDSGNWEDLAIDYARDPAQVPLNGATAVKVQRVDGGSNLVTADFA